MVTAEEIKISNITMPGQPVIVCALRDIFYSFSPDFDADDHRKRFMEAVTWYTEHNPLFKNAIIELNNGNKAPVFEIERRAVLRWIKSKKSIPGCLRPYFNHPSLKKLAELAEVYKIVIVSNSHIETLASLLIKGFTQIGMSKTEAQVVTSLVDFYDMSQYGSKKDVYAWSRILRNYDDIKAIVEDYEIHLQAAMQAANLQGKYPVACSSFIAVELAKVVEYQQ